LCVCGAWSFTVGTLEIVSFLENIKICVETGFKFFGVKVFIKSELGMLGDYCGNFLSYAKTVVGDGKFDSGGFSAEENK